MNGIGSIHLVNDSSDLRNTHAESEGAPRGGGSGRHGVRGASGDVRARGPDLGPRAPLSPPVFHPPETPDNQRLLRLSCPQGEKEMRGLPGGPGRAKPGSEAPGVQVPSRTREPPAPGPLPPARAADFDPPKKEQALQTNQLPEEGAVGPRHQGGPRVVAGRAYELGISVGR